MTTKIQQGTLTVTHTEVLVLNDAASSGNDHGASIINVFTIPAIKTIVQRIVEIPTAETGVLSLAPDERTVVPGTPFSTGYAAGHYDEDELVYLRLTNLDDTNHMELVFRDDSDDEFAVLLDHGQSYIYGCDRVTGSKATMEAAGAAVTTPPSLLDLADVTAIADAGSCDLEIYAAFI